MEIIENIKVFTNSVLNTQAISTVVDLTKAVNTAITITGAATSASIGVNVDVSNDGINFAVGYDTITLTAGSVTVAKNYSGLGFSNIRLSLPSSAATGTLSALICVKG